MVVQIPSQYSFFDGQWQDEVYSYPAWITLLNKISRQRKFVFDYANSVEHVNCSFRISKSICNLSSSRLSNSTQQTFSFGSLDLFSKMLGGNNCHHFPDTNYIIHVYSATKNMNWNFQFCLAKGLHVHYFYAHDNALEFAIRMFIVICKRIFCPQQFEIDTFPYVCTYLLGLLCQQN